MRIVRHHAYGDPRVLVVDQVAEPEPGPGQMAVAVEVAGVTWPAVKAVAAGDPSMLPAAPSGEVCGRVTGVGDGVERSWLGRRVAGTAFTGAYAEVALLAASLAVEVPDDVDAEAAVALVRGGQVALGVLAAGALEEARRVLLTAAAGGVGHLAVQLAAGHGRTVVAAVSAPAPAKTHLLTALGADVVLGYDDPWPSVDLVVDGTGGAVQQRGLDALDPFGRLVVYNGVGGVLDANDLRVHGRAVVGFSMAHLARHRPETFRRRANELWARHRAGDIRPHVSVFPLDDAAAAHDRVRHRQSLGKCALRVTHGLP